MLSQADLARRTGISRSHIANLENGLRSMDLATIRRIARALNCTVVELLLPEDAPGMPTEAEAQILKDLRDRSDYQPRVVLAAVRGMLDAMDEVAIAAEVPRSLEGDIHLSSKLTQRWNAMDDAARSRTLNLLEAAGSLSTDR